MEVPITAIATTRTIPPIRCFSPSSRGDCATKAVSPDVWMKRRRVENFSTIATARSDPTQFRGVQEA